MKNRFKSKYLAFIVSGIITFVFILLHIFFICFAWLFCDMCRKKKKKKIQTKNCHSVDVRAKKIKEIKNFMGLLKGQEKEKQPCLCVPLQIYATLLFSQSCG